MLNFFFWFFIIYLGYKLVFELLIPLFRTAFSIRSAIKNMPNNPQQSSASTNTNTFKQQAPKSKPCKDDYIDFEEIK